MLCAINGNHREHISYRGGNAGKNNSRMTKVNQKVGANVDWLGFLMNRHTKDHFRQLPSKNPSTATQMKWPLPQTHQPRTSLNTGDSYRKGHMMCNNEVPASFRSNHGASNVTIPHETTAMDCECDLLVPPRLTSPPFRTSQSQGLVKGTFKYRYNDRDLMLGTPVHLPSGTAPHTAPTTTHYANARNPIAGQLSSTFHNSFEISVIPDDKNKRPIPQQQAPTQLLSCETLAHADSQPNEGLLTMQSFRSTNIDADLTKLVTNDVHLATLVNREPSEPSLDEKIEYLKQKSKELHDEPEQMKPNRVHDKPNLVIERTELSFDFEDYSGILETGDTHSGKRKQEAIINLRSQKLMKVAEQRGRRSNANLCCVSHAVTPLAIPRISMIDVTGAQLRGTDAHLVAFPNDAFVTGTSNEGLDQRHPPRLTNSDYRSQPDITTLSRLPDKDLARVSRFTVIHNEYGQIEWENVDVRGLDLDKIVRISHQEVELYPGNSSPPVGTGLNNPATVTLYQVRAGKSREKKMLALQRFHESNGSRLISYDSESGVWKFEVDHF